MIIRDATPADFAAILALNKASVEFLSPLTPELLGQLHGSSAWHRVVEIDGAIAAFLLAFRECTSYDSPNYRWFCRRYPRFLYIDRVVVGEQARSAGLGRLLYEEAIGYTRHANVGVLCCEYDIAPPNPGSARFHARFGFAEVGRQHVADGKKQVSLQALMLAPAPG
jgi:predicted GNAT superfamily acetyltransferase